MSVLARFRVHSLRQMTNCSEVELHAMYSPDQIEDDPILKEIRSFYEATPNGVLKMTIANQAAEEQFQVDDEFYVRLDKIPTDKTVAAVSQRKAKEAEANAGG